MELPLPDLNVGRRVRVIVNERNHAAHEGLVERVIWHHKDQRSNYYLIELGKRISKRYFADDLEVLN